MGSIGLGGRRRTNNAKTDHGQARAGEKEFAGNVSLSVGKAPSKVASPLILGGSILGRSPSNMSNVQRHCYYCDAAAIDDSNRKEACTVVE